MKKTKKFEDLIEVVHIDELKMGDTVIMDGVQKTVGRKDLKDGGFYGRTLFGDSHRAGLDKITRVTFGAEIHRRKMHAKRAYDQLRVEENAHIAEEVMAEEMSAAEESLAEDDNEGPSP